MIITKQILDVLRYIYRKKSVSYLELRKKFKKETPSKDTLFLLASKSFIVQSGGCISEDGGPVPITDNTMFQLNDLGIAEVERSQWFDGKFVLLQIILPIVIAIITTLITLSLSTLLSPYL